MRVHHLNFGTLCPVPRRLINGDGGLFEPGRMVCHGWAIEGPDGLVLVDTGIGREALAAPWPHLGPVMLGVARPRLDPTETAVAQLAALGFTPADVSDIVLTHLDSDHAGALSDFPHARVHVHGKELEAALTPSRQERLRYRPAIWAHGPRWVRHAVAGDRWNGFEAIHALTDEILLVPLAGHTFGHCGVAVRQGDGWLLHAGDAYFHHDEIHAPSGRCPFGLALFQNFMESDNRARLANQARLRDLARIEGIRIICSHDASELAACQSSD